MSNTMFTGLLLLFGFAISLAFATYLVDTRFKFNNKSLIVTSEKYDFIIYRLNDLVYIDCIRLIMELKLGFNIDMMDIDAYAKTLDKEPNKAIMKSYCEYLVREELPLCSEYMLNIISTIIYENLLDKGYMKEESKDDNTSSNDKFKDFKNNYKTNSH